MYLYFWKVITTLIDLRVFVCLLMPIWFILHTKTWIYVSKKLSSQERKKYSSKWVSVHARKQTPLPFVIMLGYLFPKDVGIQALVLETFTFSYESHAGNTMVVLVEVKCEIITVASLTVSLVHRSYLIENHRCQGQGVGRMKPWLRDLSARQVGPLTWQITNSLGVSL